MQQQLRTVSLVNRPRPDAPRDVTKLQATFSHANACRIDATVTKRRDAKRALDLRHAAWQREKDLGLIYPETFLPNPAFPPAGVTTYYPPVEQVVDEEDEDSEDEIDPVRKERSALNCKSILRPLARALKSIRDERFGYPFREPVDTTHYRDYLSFVDEPMDISTVLDVRYRNNFYTSVGRFIDDVNLIWDNAMKYNQPNTDCYFLAQGFKDRFKKAVKSMRLLADESSSSSSSRSKGASRSKSRGRSRGPSVKKEKSVKRERQRQSAASASAGASADPNSSSSSSNRTRAPTSPVKVEEGESSDPSWSESPASGPVPSPHQQAFPAQQVKVKRNRGRPKGSVNKRRPGEPGSKKQSGKAKVPRDKSQKSRSRKVKQQQPGAAAPGVASSKGGANTKRSVKQEKQQRIKTLPASSAIKREPRPKVEKAQARNMLPKSEFDTKLGKREKHSSTLTPTQPKLESVTPTPRRSRSPLSSEERAPEPVSVKQQQRSRPKLEDTAVSVADMSVEERRRYEAQLDAQKQQEKAAYDVFGVNPHSLQEPMPSPLTVKLPESTMGQQQKQQQQQKQKQLCTESDAHVGEGGGGTGFSPPNHLTPTSTSNRSVEQIVNDFRDLTRANQLVALTYIQHDANVDFRHTTELTQNGIKFLQALNPTEQKRAAETMKGLKKKQTEVLRSEKVPLEQQQQPEMEQQRQQQQQQPKAAALEAYNFLDLEPPSSDMSDQQPGVKAEQSTQEQQQQPTVKQEPGLRSSQQQQQQVRRPQNPKDMVDSFFADDNISGSSSSSAAATAAASNASLSTNSASAASAAAMSSASVNASGGGAMVALADAASRGRKDTTGAMPGLGNYDRRRGVPQQQQLGGQPGVMQHPSGAMDASMTPMQLHQQDLLYRQQQARHKQEILRRQQQLRLQQEQEQQRLREQQIQQQQQQQRARELQMREQQERQRRLQEQAQAQAQMQQSGMYAPQGQSRPPVVPRHDSPLHHAMTSPALPPEGLQKKKLTHDDVIHMPDEEILKYKPYIRPEQWNDVLRIREDWHAKEQERVRKYEAEQQRQQQEQIIQQQIQQQQEMQRQQQQQQRQQALAEEQQRRVAAAAAMQQQQHAAAVAEQRRRSQSRGPSLPPHRQQQPQDANLASMSQHAAVPNTVDSSRHSRSRPRSTQLVSNAAIPSLGLGILNPQAAAAAAQQQQQQQNAAADAQRHLSSMSRSPHRGPIDAAPRELRQRQSMSRSVERPASLQVATGPEEVGEERRSSGPMSPKTEIVKNNAELESLKAQLDKLRKESEDTNRKLREEEEMRKKAESELQKQKSKNSSSAGPPLASASPQQQAAADSSSKSPKTPAVAPSTSSKPKLPAVLPSTSSRPKPKQPVSRAQGSNGKNVKRKGAAAGAGGPKRKNPATKRKLRPASDDLSDSDAGAPAPRKQPVKKKPRTNKSVLQQQRERLAGGGAKPSRPVSGGGQKRPRVKAEGGAARPNPKRPRVANGNGGGQSGGPAVRRQGGTQPVRRVSTTAKNTKRSPVDTSSGAKVVAGKKKGNKLSKIKSSFKREQAVKKAAYISAQQQSSKKLRPISPARVAPVRTSAPDPSTFASSSSSSSSAARQSPPSTMRRIPQSSPTRVPANRSRAPTPSYDPNANAASSSSAGGGSTSRRPSPNWSQNAPIRNAGLGKVSPGAPRSATPLAQAPRPSHPAATQAPAAPPSDTAPVNNPFSKFIPPKYRQLPVGGVSVNKPVAAPVKPKHELHDPFSDSDDDDSDDSDDSDSDSDSDGGLQTSSQSLQGARPGMPNGMSSRPRPSPTHPMRPSPGGPGAHPLGGHRPHTAPMPHRGGPVRARIVSPGGPLVAAAAAQKAAKPLPQNPRLKRKLELEAKARQSDEAARKKARMEQERIQRMREQERKKEKMGSKKLWQTLLQQKKKNDADVAVEREKAAEAERKKRLAEEAKANAERESLREKQKKRQSAAAAQKKNDKKGREHRGVLVNSQTQMMSNFASQFGV